MDELERRMQELEQRQQQVDAPKESAVVICPDGELPDEYLFRLQASGQRKSADLCVPKMPESEDEIAAWAASTARHQRWLLQHGHRIADGADPSRDDLIRRAYIASLGDGPMPDG